MDENKSMHVQTAPSDKHKQTQDEILHPQRASERVCLNFSNLMFDKINTMHTALTHILRSIVNKFSHQIFDCIHFR